MSDPYERWFAALAESRARASAYERAYTQWRLATLGGAPDAALRAELDAAALAASAAEQELLAAGRALPAEREEKRSPCRITPKRAR